MKPLIVGAAAAIAFAGIAAGTFWILRPSGGRFAECGNSAVAGQADIGGQFTLVSETGETVTDADVISKPSLVYFGYTFCPDVCPMDSARNADAVDLLSERGVDAQAVFISVDPERDTPEVVRDFTDIFGSEMVGLTGSPEQIADVSRVYRTYYRAEDTDEEYYLVDHSTFTYLVLPEHGFVEFFRRDATAEEIADTTACFVAAAS